MKQVWLFFLCFFFSLPMSSQHFGKDEKLVEIMDVGNPEFNWPQFDNDNAECKIRKGSLTLECKKNKSFVCVTTELDLDIIGVNCIIAFRLEPEELDDKHPWGIVYDYKNYNNFKVLCFGRKEFQLVNYEGGEKAIVRQGLFKLDDKEKVLIILEKRKKRLDFYIGRQKLPLLSLRNSNIQNSTIGIYVENKTKIKLSGIGYRLMMEKEYEE